jgi:hypothetical protein
MTSKVTATTFSVSSGRVYERINGQLMPLLLLLLMMMWDFHYNCAT